MKSETLLLDDYGMFLFRRLHESWNNQFAIRPHSSSMTLEKQSELRAANQEFNRLFDDLTEHLILLLEHPDILLRREDEQHLTLDRGMIEILAKHSKHREALRQIQNTETRHNMMGTWGQLFNSIEAFWDNNPVIFKCERYFRDLE